MKPENEKKGKTQIDLEKLTDGKLKGKIDVVSDDIAFQNLSEGAPLVCSRVKDHPPLEGIFIDNKIGRCVVCNEEIYYRPYNECATRKVCMYCILELAE